MTNPCGCGDSNEDSSQNNVNPSQAPQQVDQPAECPALVHETVCVSADITITPNVAVGAIASTCVGGPVIGACPGTPVSECTFTVSQNICVQIPLVFSANATATPSGIVCGTPATGGCTV